MDPNSIVQPESDESKAKQEQEEQVRRDLLATLLDTAARERCTFQSIKLSTKQINHLAVSRIALVSPERSKQIEIILLRMAQTGQLRGRVSEEQLISLLDQVSSSQIERSWIIVESADGGF